MLLANYNPNRLHSHFANFAAQWDTQIPLPLANTPMKDLEAVELATSRISVGVQTVFMRGVMWEMVSRLHDMGSHGTLSHFSLGGLARLVEYVHYPRPTRLKMPLRGLEVLRLADATDGTGIRIDLSSPTPNNPYLFRPIRLRDRICELAEDPLALSCYTS